LDPAKRIAVSFGIIILGNIKLRYFGLLTVRTNDLNIEEDSEYESQTEPLNNAQNYDDIPEDFPLVSERAGHGDHSDNSVDEKHVQFGGKKKIVVTPPSLSYDEQPTDQSHERKRRRR